MNAKEAADHIRPGFHLEAMPAEARHHVKFVEEVATELGIEHSAFNLHQVADALDAADIKQDSNEFPKMLYAMRHHSIKGIEASVYDPRNDFVWAKVNSDAEAASLGDGWVDDPAKLSPRGDTPIDAPKPESVPEMPEPVVEVVHDPLLDDLSKESV